MRITEVRISPAKGGKVLRQVVKIDIEGGERPVLETLFNELAPENQPRLLICELAHDDDGSLARLLQERGYTLAARGRLNGIYRRQP